MVAQSKNVSRLISFTFFSSKSSVLRESRVGSVGVTIWAWAPLAIHTFFAAYSLLEMCRNIDCTVFEVSWLRFGSLRP